MTTQEHISALERNISNHPFLELSPQTYKAKRNLYIACIACWAVFLGGGIRGFTSGLTIEGLPFQYADYVVLVLTIYFFAYFIVLGWIDYSKWRIRITGETLEDIQSEDGLIRIGVQTDFTINQSNVYSNIITASRKLIPLLNNMVSSQQQLIELTEDNKTKKRDDIEIGRIHNLIRSLDERTEKANKLVESLTKIEPKLNRFLTKFIKFQRRLFLKFFFEFWLPVIIGGTSLIAMGLHFFLPITWPWATQ